MDYTENDYIRDTKEHINLVKNFMLLFAEALTKRAYVHDQSKLESPEKEIFCKYTPELDNCPYGSEEYKEHLKKLKVALDHHYANNSHHPEFYENGIRGMNLLDIVEMMCDWLASTMKHQGSDIQKSIHINQERFQYSDDLKQILENSIDIFQAEKEKIEKEKVIINS